MAERRTALAERRAQDAEDLRAAYTRADLLAREMDHRIKNLFTVIGAMISLAGRQSSEARPAMEALRGQVNALSIAHGLGSGQGQARMAELGDVVRAAVKPYEGGGHRITVAGPEVELPVEVLSPLGLILHELATNAVKYRRARARRARAFDVRWTRDGGGGGHRLAGAFWHGARWRCRCRVAATRARASARCSCGRRRSRSARS